MNFLNLIRSTDWSYKLARQGLMTYRRWRFGLDNVHHTFYMARGCRVSSDLAAHEYSFVNIGCILGPKVELGRYAMLAPYVAVVGGDHLHDIPGKPIIFSGRPGLKRTYIGEDVWIGFGAIIFSGVTIGRGAIIGAGTVVTKNVPPFEIHGGVPNRKIGERFPDPKDRQTHEQMLEGAVVTPEFCPPWAK